ncbi:MAG: permease [bacterium]|nr:permease [bacterium]
MKNYLKKNYFDFIIIALFIIFIGVSTIVKFKPGVAIFQINFVSFVKEMIAFLPLLFIIIGLFDEFVEKEKIMKHIGEYSGIKGSVIVILLATLQAGPLYGAFPVAYILWKKGCSIRNIFIYIGAFTTMKIPMLTFEITFLGVKFSLLRTLISLPVFIIIALLMEKILKPLNFEVNDGK